MPNITPNSVTEVVPAGWTANDIVAALSAFFNGGGSTSFVREFAGTDAFVIQASADPGPQYSVRATSSTRIDIEIEPSGSLTDAGNGSTRPAGASADNSGANHYVTLGASTGVGSKIWVIEHDDCVTVLIKNTAGTNWEPSFQIGRVYTPSFPEVNIPLGRDGLGFFAGVPNSLSSASPNAWLEEVNKTNGTLIHVSNGIWLNGFAKNFAQDNSADNAGTVGFVQPYQIPMCCQSMANSMIGTLKYAYRSGVARSPLTRIDLNNSTDLAFIVGHQLYGGTTFLIPWLRGVVP